MADHYDAIEVSIIMATFNPSWDKCKFTLDSIVSQKDVEIELIVTDDGSSDNLFNRFDEYLRISDFCNYKLIGHESNQGTVKNYYDGIKAAKGKYVKLISPGDALFNETVLADWLSALRSSGLKWSFGDAAYYRVENGKKEIVKAPAYPRLINCYESGDEKSCRWNYVVLEDVALGAALICERQVFSHYLERFIGVSKYAEDVAFIAMMYDGILPEYYNRNVVFYEFGTGVSTGEKKWRALIHQDQKNAERVIISECNGDELQRKIAKALRKINSVDGFRKRIRKNIQKNGIKKVLKYRICPRLSSADISSCGNWWN